MARDGAGAGVVWQVAGTCEFSSLQQASLEAADVVVAATGDDEDNLLVCLLARQEFGVPGPSPGSTILGTSGCSKTWGVDVAVSAPHLITSLVEEAVTVGSLVRLLRLEGGAGLVEVTLDELPRPNTPSAKWRSRGTTTCVAIVRDQSVVVPRGDTVLVGDEVLALTLPDTEGDLREVLVGTTPP